MTYYRFPDKPWFKACFVLFLLAVQLLARSTMVTNVFLGFVPAQMMMMTLVLAAGIFFLIYNRKKLRQIVTDRRVIAVIGITALMLLSMMIKQDWQTLYFSILFYIYFAVFLNFFLPMEELARYYVLMLFWLSAYAIVGQFALKPMVHMGIIPGHPFDSSGGWHMFNFGLAFVVDKNIMMDDAMRAFSIFREPGLYQIFLFIAIQLNNYTVRWDKPWKMWVVDAVLFVALLITFATGGVLALGLYIVFLFFDKGLYRNKRILAAAIAAVFVGVVVLIVALLRDGTWAYELVGMMEKIFLKTDSYTDRVGSIIMDAKLFLQHPLVGNRISEVLYSVPNNTASSPILFASFGIVGGCIHVASWVALAWRKERSVIMNLILLVILFVPFNTQNVIHDMFFWLFPIAALLEKGLPLLDNIRTKKV